MIHKDIDRDFYMGAGQAKEYGLIDDVLPPAEEGRGGEAVEGPLSAGASQNLPAGVACRKLATPGGRV